jgi:hypothetical protein
MWAQVIVGNIPSNLLFLSSHLQATFDKGCESRFKDFLDPDPGIRKIDIFVKKIVFAT